MTNKTDLEKLFHDSEYQKQAAEARDRALRLYEAKQLSKLTRKYQHYLELIIDYTKQNQGHLIGFFKLLDQRMNLNEISGIDEIYERYTTEAHQDFLEIAVELVGRYHLSNLLALMGAIAEERSKTKLHTQSNNEDACRPTDNNGGISVNINEIILNKEATKEYLKAIEIIDSINKLLKPIKLPKI